jgi:demethylmenaquinone methyltransferase/2-methoxy-6-polyprenyl-1,4-benzoquinol methylase
MSNQSSPNSTEIQAIFDQIAPEYDRLNQELSLGLHRIWKLMTVKWCQPEKGDFALDVCCGSGDLTNLLSKQVGKTGQVIGLDFSPQQLKIARQRFSATNINWMEGDALNLPFADSSFDCATIGYGLRNVVDTESSNRVLKRRFWTSINPPKPSPNYSKTGISIISSFPLPSVTV